MSYPTPPTWAPQPQPTYCDTCGKRRELGSQFCAGCGRQLPPEPAAPNVVYVQAPPKPVVDDVAIWFLAFSPLISLVIALIIAAAIGGGSATGLLVGLVVSLGLWAWDIHNLKKAGMDDFAWGVGLILMPLYVGMRQHHVKKTMAPLVVMIVTLVLLIITIVALAGSTTKVNATDVENDIKSQPIPGDSINAVSCPANVDDRVGNTFVCMADMADGTAQSVVVTIHNTSGSGHYFTWEKP